MKNKPTHHGALIEVRQVLQQKLFKTVGFWTFRDRAVEGAIAKLDALIEAVPDLEVKALDICIEFEVQYYKDKERPFIAAKLLHEALQEDKDE